MTVIACGQFDILGDECPGCGGGLSDYQQGGYAGEHGVRYCSEDCIVAAQESAKLADQRHHLNVRDLMCACEVCTRAGHPTAGELAEWREYQASRGSGVVR